MKNIILFIIITHTLFACKQPGENSQKENKVATQYPVRVIDSISAESLIQHIKILSSDEFGGRAPASEGEILTIEYIENEFRKAGLSPGNGKKYTQKVPLASIEVTNKPSLLVSKTRADNANEAVMRLNYSNDQVVWTRQQVDAVSINNSELVFVGYGINAPERNWNDYAGIDVKGKTVVMLVNDPGYATQDEQLFNGNAMTYYGRWDYKFDEAGRQGAAAAIIIHDTKPAAYGWSTVANSWTGLQFDTVHGSNQQSLVSVEGWITFENAKKLFRHANLSLDDMYAMAKTPEFEAVNMNLKASVAIENKQAFIESYNVMAMVEGSEKPNEVFIYMAHWDHLGTDLSLEGDGIYNGALDNATGIAGLIELAKVFAISKPKRSVVFIAVTAEEQGLLGSAYYAANPVFPLNSTIAGINMDGLNNFGPTNDVTVIGLGMSEIDTFLKKAAADQGRVLKPDAESEKGYFYRSDHFELSKLGVPMSYPNSGYDHFEKGVAYGIEKSEEYLNNNYHRVSDEYDPSWDMTGAVQDLQLYYATGLEIINSGLWPQWYEGTEFKEIRDSQMREKK
ncbi:Peptidase M28 [hydrothermal vent metagenome]|uniref:Peptidase M28 n=1 Tax=hydrothermal vent metagenome TaxID=652676 RepID=A0A3B0W143_9ZZZZ